jgi:hypothetical protein
MGQNNKSQLNSCIFGSASTAARGFQKIFVLISMRKAMAGRKE